MGEIKIKSGNLFDINGEHISHKWDGKECLVIENDAIIVNQIRPGYMTGIYYDKEYKEGTYTLIIQADSSQFINRQVRLVSSAPFLGSAWNESYHSYTADMNKQDALHYISFTVNEPTKIGFFVNGYFESGDKLVSIQLLEGTYTSETIPEYQPYFLNRPAHQFVNGQWVDIPTHHYTNGRWQGELTSQSPLKFRADGDMLDWRVEGKTSQNLFDIGKNVNDYERAYQMISVDGSLISMKLEGSGMTFHYRTHNITTTGTVTIYCKGSKAKPQLFVRLRSMDDTKWLTNSDVTISGMTYNSVYNGWFSYAMDDTFIKTIIIPECLYWNMGVGFNSTAGTMGEIVTISNPMVISGTYTASTLPPYEPYGGVGDWDETAQRYRIPVTVNGVTTTLYTDHQLMDGDSIDYATDQTAIPIATGNNILTVDTAVKPSKVFIEFEG